MANRQAIDRYLSEGRREFEMLRDQARKNHPAFYSKLAEFRQIQATKS